MKISNFKFQISNYKKGFTLVELIVVMAIFLFVIGAAIAIFLSIVQSQRRVFSQQQLLNQVSYAEEYISKALRMAGTDASGSCLGTDNIGYVYLLTRYDGSSGLFKGIKFLNQSDPDNSGNPACQEYFLAGSGTSADPYILKALKNSTNDSDALAITSTNLKINFVKFSIDGSNGSTFISSPAESCASATKCGAKETDTAQPRVTILLNAQMASDSQGSSSTIQTTISRRNLNVQP